MKTAGRFACFALTALVALGTASAQADGWVPAADPSGRWVGQWTSFGSGHHGLICARVRQLDACTYKARFSGTFFGVIPFTYSVPLSVTGYSEDGRTYLAGQKRLPMFGTFCCRAEVSCCDFIASYQADKDQGEFVMRRR